MLHRGTSRCCAWLVGLALVAPGCAELGIDTRVMEQVLARGGGAGPGLDESTVVSGLKEALRVGTERTVSRTSREGGFWNDPLLRIALPEEMEGMARALRAVGMGARVDALELSMNRAAETASAEAKGVFWQAVRSMSISAAYDILNGPEDAATRYFRGRTESTLRERFSPIVERAMQEVGLYRAYDAVVSRYSALAVLGSPTVELDRYVTDETLEGLFTVLAQEEARIRNDPVARSTELLRRVFGRS